MIKVKWQVAMSVFICSMWACKKEEKLSSNDNQEQTAPNADSVDNSSDVKVDLPQQEIETNIENSEISTTPEEKQLTEAEQLCQQTSFAMAGGTLLSCGENTNDHSEILSMAGLYMVGSDPLFLRSGSAVVIDKRVLLGAAHTCEKLQEGDNMKNARFQFGDLLSTDNRFESNIASCLMHPLYKTQGNLYFDIAVFHLNQDVPEMMKPIEVLPPAMAAEVAAGSNLTLAGYGLDGSLNDLTSNQLRLGIADIALATVNADSASFTYTSENGVGHSIGDSGGPAFYKKDGQLYAAGVITGYSDAARVLTAHVSSLNKLKNEIATIGAETIVFRGVDIANLSDDAVMQMFPFQTFELANQVIDDFYLLLDDLFWAPPDYQEFLFEDGENGENPQYDLYESMFTNANSFFSRDHLVNREYNTVGLGIEHYISQTAPAYDWIMERIGK